MLANLVSSGIPLLLLPVLTRVLSPAEYGEVVMFQLIIVASNALSGFSVHGALGVAWFKRGRADLSNLAGAAIIVAAGSAALFAALSAIFFLLVGSDIFGLAPIWGSVAVATAGLNVLLQCRLVLWQSQQRPLPMAALQIASSVLNVGLSLIFVIAMELGAEGRNAGIALSAFMMAVTAIFMLTHQKQASWNVQVKDIRFLIKFGLSLAPHAFAGVLIAAADRYIVSAYLGHDMLGIYGAAAQLGAVMLVVGDAFGKAFNPWVYHRMASQRKEDALAVVGAMYIAIPCFLVLGVFMGAILTWSAPFFLGDDFLAASELFYFFTLGGAFGGIYLVVSGLYFFSAKTSLLSALTLSVAIIGTGATIILASNFQMAGAVAGYVLIQAMLAMSVWVVARRVFSLPWNDVLAASMAWLSAVFVRYKDV
jgi:O-antigen/teichoic acid export membrane protein